MANQQTVRWEYEEGEIEVGEQLRTGTFFSHVRLHQLEDSMAFDRENKQC